MKPSIVFTLTGLADRLRRAETFDPAYMPRRLAGLRLATGRTVAGTDYLPPFSLHPDALTPAEESAARAASVFYLGRQRAHQAMQDAAKRRVRALAGWLPVRRAISQAQAEFPDAYCIEHEFSAKEIRKGRARNRNPESLVAA